MATLSSEHGQGNAQTEDIFRASQATERSAATNYTDGSMRNLSHDTTVQPQPRRQQGKAKDLLGRLSKVRVVSSLGTIHG